MVIKTIIITVMETQCADFTLPKEKLCSKPNITTKKLRLLNTVIHLHLFKRYKPKTKVKLLFYFYLHFNNCLFITLSTFIGPNLTIFESLSNVLVTYEK